MLSKWHRPAVAVVIVLAFAALPLMLLANHSWGTYHWSKGSGELQLNVGDNVSSAWDAYLDEAISDWNRSTVIHLTKVAGGTRAKTCKPTAGRIEACSERYGNTGWLGIAQIWLSGGHIAQAITKVNDTYFNTATYNKPEWRRLVMCQEIAHDFGLDHQDENFNNGNLGSCMDYTSNPLGPPSNEHPNSHDYEQLLAIYNHSHSSQPTGGGPGRGNAGAPPAFNQVLPEGPGQWGRLVRQSRDGGISTYELDFGGGYKVITHVTWTVEMAEKNRAHMQHD